MANLTADEVLKRFAVLENKRGRYEGAWDMCSDYVLPLFGNNQKAWKIFDSTAPLALGRFAAALKSVLTPSGRKWHGLTTGRPELDGDASVNKYLEDIRDILFNARLAPEANFENQIIEAYLSLGVYGTAVMLVTDLLGQGLQYRCVPLREVYLADNAAGQVDTVFRAYKLTARQALAEFGEALPENIKKDAEDSGHMDREFEFVHGVFPRRDFDPRRADAAHMPVASVVIAREARVMVRESGFRSMPYAVSRFNVAPGEVYGRSPAMEVMADIVQVNAMAKTILRAAEKMVNPPLLVAEDDVLSAFSLKAGSINYGGLDHEGRPRVSPLSIGGDLPVGLEMLQSRQKVINEAFYITLFQILVETPRQTATEVVERAQEKAQLLAPVMGRQQSELLRPIINREVDILSAAGVIPLPPEELDQAEVHPKYETPMTAALEAGDAQAVVQVWQAVAAMAQASPAMLDIIDFDQAGRIVIRSFGAPASIRNDDEKIAGIRQARQEQEQQAALTRQAQMAIGGLEGLAGAEAKLSQAANSRTGGMMGDVGNG